VSSAQPPVFQAGALGMVEASMETSMPAIIVATVRITDPERYAVYAKTVAGLSEKHGGVTLAKGAVSEVLEGDGVVGERVVVVSFPTVEDARGYIGSAQYEAGKAARLGAAEVVMRLIEA
jgi:uncharacterized protein (DUF1330 family)